MSRWIPAFVHELSDAEAAAALASMPGHARAEMDRLSKAEAVPEKPKAPRWRITGIASTEHVDKQGDTIRQAGLDWRPFLESGYINDDHGRGAEHVIGYPTKVRKITLRDPKGGKPVAATAIEGYLFDIERAEKLANLAKSMEGTERQMGFSVEGPAPKRSANDPKEIIEATINHVAFTPWPVNPNALAVVSMASLAKSFAKAMEAGDGVATPNAEVPGDVAPLIVQDLIGAGRRKKREALSIKGLLVQFQAALAAATNKPAGTKAAEGERMDPQKFLKGKLAKMSPAEATKFAKQMGWEPEDDEGDDEMEKSTSDLDLLLKSMARNAAEAHERNANLDKSAEAIGGLVKSGGADAGLLKSLFADVQAAFEDHTKAADVMERRLAEATQVAIDAGVLTSHLAKSMKAMGEKIDGLTEQIAQATGRAGTPRAAVNAKPVARFADDSVPGSLAKSEERPLGGLNGEQAMDALVKGARDAYRANNADLGNALSNIVTKLAEPNPKFDASERDLIKKTLKG